MKISDLHTHPSLKPFQNKEEQNNTFQNIWNGVIGRNSYFFQLPGIVRDQIKETARDSQSHLNEFISGDLQTAAIVIHPIEKGWFMRPRKKGRRFWKWLITRFVNDKKLPLLLASMTGIPLEKSRNYIKTAFEPVDYYKEETFPEYDYIASQEPMSATWDHQFELVKDHQSYTTAKANGKIPLFLSIEGGHALLDIPDGKMHRTEYTDLTPSQKAHLDQSLVQNINRIKGTGNDSFDQAHTPIYVTLTHMYQNFLAGHSRSYLQGQRLFPGIGDLLDQDTGLNVGLTELGEKAIDLLTSSQNGSRILIDVKHLSVKARNQYYQIAKDKNLPVVASHVAMAGVELFSETPKDSRKEHSENYFSKWSINLSDDDARVINETDGIMGIALHEGRMPGGRANERIKDIKKEITKGHALEELLRREYMKLTMSNIFQAVIAINKKEAWTRIMIGSDYDGIMNPFDIYPKTSYFQRFVYDMEKFLENPFDLIVYRNSKQTTLTIAEIQDRMFGYTPKQIVQMIAIENFENFIQRHF